MSLARILRAIQGIGLKKPIQPNDHAVLDYLTISAFMLAAGATWDSNRRASVSALVNGLFVLSFSMFTDYSGSARRLISFPVHGQLDIVQAAMAATMPTLLGFEDTGAATFFHGQAMNEAMVLAITDFYREQQRRSMRRTA